LVGGAIVNALAFSGGNCLFSLLGRSDEADRERKRHDLAIEALQRAESEYRHKCQLRLEAQKIVEVGLMLRQHILQEQKRFSGSFYPSCLSEPVSKPLLTFWMSFTIFSKSL